MFVRFMVLCVLLLVLACLIRCFLKRKTASAKKTQKDEREETSSNGASNLKPLWLTMRDEKLRNRVRERPTSRISRPSVRLRQNTTQTDDDDDSPQTNATTNSFSRSNSCHSSSHHHSSNEFGGGHCGGKF